MVLDTSLKDALGAAYERQLRGVTWGTRSVGLSKSASAIRMDATDIVPEHSVQQLIRPAYGLGTAQDADFGDHPEFRHLRGTDDSEFCAITTLFMDVENSTKLGLIYSAQDVFRIKNSFISLAIESVRGFNGHVHRIMGDAVMAYFGGKTVTAEEGAINALNCAAFLQYLAANVVAPALEKEGFSEGLGVRVGIDHGPAEKVLWRAYGYPGIEEVTATAFHVDAAAKLQHAAGRNNVMLGQTLKCLLDFPDELLRTKTVERDGKDVPQRYLLPNFEINGAPHNYTQHLLSTADYLGLGPIGLRDRELGERSEIRRVPVRVDVYDRREGSRLRTYKPCATMLPKNLWLAYRLDWGDTQPQIPYKVKFAVENHGAEAGKFPGNGNHSEPYTISNWQDSQGLVHWESTSYRGLHYLGVEVTNMDNRPLKRSKLGVFIE